MPITPPTVPTLPDPPERTDPVNFRDKADARLAAEPAWSAALQSLAQNTYDNTVESAENAAMITGARGVLVRNLTFNSAGAAVANSTAMQTAFDAIPSGGFGTVEIQTLNGNAAADLYLSDTNRPDQGTRHITLIYPAGIRLRDAPPVVSEVRTKVKGATYSFSASVHPVDPGSRFRPELLGTDLAAGNARRVTVHNPVIGDPNIVAERWDHIVPYAEANAGFYGRLELISRVYDQRAGNAYFDRWTLMRTATAAGSGLANSPAVTQGGSYITHEINPQNLHADTGFTRSMPTAGPVPVFGVSLIPECEDYDAFGTRVGYNINASWIVSPSPVAAATGIHAKTYSAFHADPNSVAPGGNLITAAGNDRANAGLIAAYGGRGGTADSADDPGAIIDGFLYWKTGLKFTDAVFEADRAITLGVNQKITQRDPVGLSEDWAVLGPYGSTTSYAVSSLSVGGSVLLTVRNQGRVLFKAEGAFTDANTYLEVQPKLNEARIVVQPDGATNAGLTLAALGTGTINLDNPFKPKAYTLGTLPSASVFSGAVIEVSDATGGAKLCRSNGTNWQLINTTTTVS